MLIFFAGTDGQGFAEIARKGGAKNFLNSFYSLGCGKQPPVARDFATNYILDSGGYSARVHGITIDVKQYAEYLNKYKIKFAFNLDVLDLNESLQNFYYLMKNTNTYIMPVYHGPEWLHKETRGLIDYYVDCFPFIALGGIAGKEVSQKNSERFLAYVFNRTRDKVMVHGLGCTSVPRLQKYPFFCVDSTSWLATSKYGSSEVYSDEMAKIRAKTRHYSDRLVSEAKYWIKVQEDITRLWERRGIKWGELDYDKLMKKRKVITYEEWKNERF